MTNQEEQFVNRLLVATFVVLLLFGTEGLIAQNKPDFSGQWALVEPADNDLSVPQELVVDHVQKTITVTRRFKDGSTSRGTYTLPYQIFTPRGNLTIDWEGDTLVFDFRRRTARFELPPEDNGRTREAWSLNSDGMLVIRTTEQSPGTESRNTEVLYRKRAILPKVPTLPAA